MKGKTGRPGTGQDMATLYSRRTKHDSRPRRRRTRSTVKVAAIGEHR